MMKMQRWYLIILLFSVPAGRAISQPVTFTNHAQLLKPVFGFSFSNCAVDMNADYLDDVVRVRQDALIIDYQQADGSFLQKVFPMNIQATPDWSICAGDLDRNGFNDLLFGNSNTVSFLLANVDGSVYVETVAPVYIFCQRSTLADIDNDGNLDAFVCNDTEQSIPFRNNGNGTMTPDYTLLPTDDSPGSYSAIWTDYDNDGDIDLYITKCVGGAPPSEPGRINLLYRNNGDGTFSEVGAQAHLDDNAQSWSTVFEDFDNDGDMDAFIVNHDMQNRLFRNNGDGTFTDVIDAAGIDPFDLGAWENAAGDFNNDGFVDIFSELTRELYLGNGDLTFTGQDLPVSGGGIGDFNNDGFLDVVNGNDLWLNDGNPNNWLKVNTSGIASNPNGIGARVEIHGSWGIQIREVRSGQSFYPMSALTAHFGLGQATYIDSLVVKWPSGIRTVVKNPPVNSSQTIHEAPCLLPPTLLTVNGHTQLCPNETVELSAPAGFSVEWSDGSTGQVLLVSEPGNYKAILTDSAGCVSFSNTVTISIIQEVPPVISVLGKPVFCKGDSLTLLISEGKNPLWSNGMTGHSIVVTETGSYTVSVDAQCHVERLTSLPVDVFVLDAPEPVVTNATIGEGDSILLSAAGDMLYWYDSATDGTLLGTSNTLQTPPLSQSTTYYVESHTAYPGEIQHGGKPDTNGGGGLPSQGGWSIFDVWEPFTLLSVNVVVPQNAPAGLRSVQLVDGNDIVLAEAIFNLAPGQHQLPLNFEVPTGDNLSLRCPQNNLFRNNSGVTYPYPIGEVGIIKTSIFGGSYYYYFYNWKIQKESFECVSDRVAVTVTVTEAGELHNSTGWSVFPNPAGDMIFIKMENKMEGFVLLQLFDSQGRRVLQKEVALSSGVATLDLWPLAAGAYWLQTEIDGKSAGESILIR